MFHTAIREKKKRKGNRGKGKNIHKLFLVTSLSYHTCEEELKQIHTPGPSRAVQRSVSVLGDTGLFYRESAIWRPLQIVGDVLLHAWGGKRHETHTHTYGGVWEHQRGKSSNMTHSQHTLQTWAHTSKNGLTLISFDRKGNKRHRNHAFVRNSEPTQQGVHLLPRGMTACRQCHLKYNEVHELQGCRTYSTYVKWVGLPGVMWCCSKSITASLLIWGWWWGGDITIHHFTWPAHLTLLTSLTTYSVGRSCGSLTLTSTTGLLALSSYFERRRRSWVRYDTSLFLSIKGLIIVPWVMTAGSEVSTPGLTDAVGLFSSVPLSSLRSWAAGRPLWSLVRCSGAADEVLGEVLLFSGEILSLERSVLGWWRSTGSGYVSAKCIFFSYIPLLLVVKAPFWEWEDAAPLALALSASLPAFSLFGPPSPSSLPLLVTQKRSKHTCPIVNQNFVWNFPSENARSRCTHFCVYVRRKISLDWNTLWGKRLQSRKQTNNLEWCCSPSVWSWVCIFRR